MYKLQLCKHGALMAAWITLNCSFTILANFFIFVGLKWINIYIYIMYVLVLLIRHLLLRPITCIQSTIVFESCYMFKIYRTHLSSLPREIHTLPADTMTMKMILTLVKSVTCHPLFWVLKAGDPLLVWFVLLGIRIVKRIIMCAISKMIGGSKF